MIEQSTNLDQLAPALVKAQTMIQPAIRDARNPHFKSKYATLGSVWDAVRDALAANDLAVVQMPAQGAPEHCTIAMTIVHASGQWIRSVASIPIARRFSKDGRDLGVDAQGYGAAFTYARRYALAAALGVVTDEDDDGNAASHPPRSQGAAYREPAPAPAKKGNGNGKREQMLYRIGDMEQEAARIGIECRELCQEIMQGTPLNDASEAKLEEYGKALKALLQGAEVSK